MLWSPLTLPDTRSHHSRPVASQVAAEAIKLGLGLLSDLATDQMAANEPLRARQLRGAIERLGPAYVKVAQALSTRVDLLSPQYFEQIQLLQDRVPPFSDVEAKAVMAQVGAGSGAGCSKAESAVGAEDVVAPGGDC